MGGTSHVGLATSINPVRLCACMEARCMECTS